MQRWNAMAFALTTLQLQHRTPPPGLRPNLVVIWRPLMSHTHSMQWKYWLFTWLRSSGRSGQISQLDSKWLDEQGKETCLGFLLWLQMGCAVGFHAAAECLQSPAGSQEENTLAFLSFYRNEEGGGVDLKIC